MQTMKYQAQSSERRDFHQERIRALRVVTYSVNRAIL